jgi:hypothetical protein
MFLCFFVYFLLYFILIFLQSGISISEIPKSTSWPRRGRSFTPKPRIDTFLLEKNCLCMLKLRPKIEPFLGGLFCCLQNRCPRWLIMNSVSPSPSAVMCQSRPWRSGQSRVCDQAGSAPPLGAEQDDGTRVYWRAGRGEAAAARRRQRRC